MKNQTHVRYLQGVKFFNGLGEIKAGEVVRITKSLGKNAAWVIRDNGDTWAEIGINGVRAEYCNPEADKTIVVHQAYRIGTPFNGSCQYRIAFLCPVRGIVEIFRQIPLVADEFEQATLVRAAITEFRNQ